MRNDRVASRETASVIPQSAFRIPHSDLPPVLCYHRIGGPLELGVTRVARSVFERQMQAVARAGWRSLRLAEYVAAVSGSQSAIRNPQSTFLLTFDDGYGSLADHAYPVLADLGFSATTFLITDFVGRHNTWDARYTWRRLEHLGWDTIGAWAGRGFDFGSHGATHRRLTWLGDDAVTDELARSRETLVRRLGEGAGRALAYPFGAWDGRVARFAAEAGYELGFGGVGGDGTPFSIARVPVYAWDVGSVPFGLRNGAAGAIGRLVAHLANRCSVGTSILRAISRQPSAVR
jgi:peptidoglycan/xylan/chitin deacetylase (PgdA/CDA1 family)